MFKSIIVEIIPVAAPLHNASVIPALYVSVNRISIFYILIVN